MGHSFACGLRQFSTWLTTGAALTLGSVGCLSEPSPQGPPNAPDAAEDRGVSWDDRAKPEDATAPRPDDLGGTVSDDASADAFATREDVRTDTATVADVVDDRGATPDVGPRSCEAFPTTPFSGRATALTEWRAAWTVPYLRAGAHPDVHGITTQDGLGNTYVSNALPWTDALPETDAGRPDDVLLSSLDGDGNFRWAVRTTGGAPGIDALLPMSSGVVATFRCAGVVAPGMIRCATSEDSLVIARFDATGALVWSRAVTQVRPGPPLLDRDTDGNVYVVHDVRPGDGGVAAPWLTALDVRGALRFSLAITTSPYESVNRLSLREGEVRIASVDRPPGGAAALRWSRRRTDGSLIAQGAFPLGDIPDGAPPEFLRQDTSVEWGPGGDLYVAQSWGSLLNEGSRGYLQRLGPCGEVRWTVARPSVPPADYGYSRQGPLKLDPSGNLCSFAEAIAAPPSRPSEHEVCVTYVSPRALFVYAPDGTLIRTIANVQFPRDTETRCAWPLSARGVSIRAVERAAFTLGDRADPARAVDAVTQYVLVDAVTCAACEHRCAGRCVDTATSTDHCGTCGRACRFPRGAGRCVGGSCRLGGCDDGFADCNADPGDGCETDLRASSAHCGACGRACGAGACAQGRCCVGSACAHAFASDGREGAFAPRADVTLSAGVHHFTSITVPAGVTVRTDGDGVLELRATGDVQIDGAIDLSGGDGATPARTVDGSGGGGGHTGRPGAASGDANGAGPGGGGGGEGFDPVSRAVTAPRGGLGVAGGASGQGYHARPLCTLINGQRAPGLDGGRRVGLEGVVMEGGHAWGVPYDGRGGEVPMTGCELIPDVAELTTANYYSLGVMAGGGSIGRAAALDLTVSTTFRPGSGGGGGAVSLATCRGRVDERGGGGGGGGGALRIASATRLTVGATGRVQANGGRGGRNAGSGSGGVIYLAAPAVTVARGAVIEAVARGVPAAPVTGLGRIRISVDPTRCTLAGTFDPPLRDGCNTTPSGGAFGYTYVGAWPW